MENGSFDKFVRAVEHIAALLMIFVTLFIFLSVMMRFFFNSPIPDTNDFGRLLLGTALMFGIAVAFYDGKHITMDTLWLSASARIKRIMDIVASLVSLVAIAVLSWMLFERIHDTYLANEMTFDLRLPIWIFYLGSGLGALCATVFTAIYLTDITSQRKSDKETKTEQPSETSDVE